MRNLIALCFAGLLLAAPETKPKKTAKPALSSMTGCVDQRGDNYVLTGDKQLKAVAVLHGEGFSDDNFAKHMGHKVTVEGTMAPAGEMPSMKVRKITEISKFCSPE